MKRSISLTALLVLALLPSAGNGDSSRITAAFGTATISVSPMDDGRRQIELPALEYDFSIYVHCEAPAQSARLSISVADTRKRFDLPDATASGSVNESLLIPARQLAPVITDGFCVDGDEASHNSLLVEGLLTSSLSLRCSAESEDTIHFASESLAVRLECVELSEDYETSSTAATER
ncbi:MAG: hypothetical protein QNJ07_15525 [Woeseiaceae bacterium]|nr:hypothetical protein [Woeseiaceae bacterium]